MSYLYKHPFKTIDGAAKRAALENRTEAKRTNRRCHFTIVRFVLHNGSWRRDPLEYDWLTAEAKRYRYHVERLTQAEYERQQAVIAAVKALGVEE